ncbi:hypothetical protein RK21_00941 [Pseudomonas plecoglossicida]|nr:hypothetical protein RK21_00941 [Pseudomonas plecoglossicida]
MGAGLPANASVELLLHSRVNPLPQVQCLSLDLLLAGNSKG